MEQDEVEIRTVTELFAAEFTVSDDGKFWRLLGRRMAVAQLLPAEIERCLHDDVGQFRQMVCQVFKRLQAGDVLCEQAEDLRVVLLAHDVHFPLGIATDFGEALCHGVAEAGEIGGDFVEARVEDFIEQDGMARQVSGCPGRTADDVRQFGQCLWILLHQGEIGPTPADRFEEVEAALPGGVGRASDRCSLNQPRPEHVETVTVLRRQLLVFRTFAETLQTLQHVLCLAEAQF